MSLKLVEKSSLDRAVTVMKMGEYLLRNDAFHTEPAAVRALLGNGFAIDEIVRLAPDACQWAMQAVVAAEMAKP